MRTKLILAAALMCGGMLAANAQSSVPSGPANSQTQGTTQEKTGGAEPAMKGAAGRTDCTDKTAAQSGGTGSPVAAGSTSGSSDRANPASGGTSGPAGAGTTASGRPC